MIVKVSKLYTVCWKASNSRSSNTNKVFVTAFKLCHFYVTFLLGWLCKDTISHFENYARFCYDKFGDRVKYWITSRVLTFSYLYFWTYFNSTQWTKITLTNSSMNPLFSATLVMITVKWHLENIVKMKRAAKLVIIAYLRMQKLIVSGFILI